MQFVSAGWCWIPSLQSPAFNSADNGQRKRYLTWKKLGISFFDRWHASVSNFSASPQFCGTDHDWAWFFDDPQIIFSLRFISSFILCEKYLCSFTCVIPVLYFLITLSEIQDFQLSHKRKTSAPFYFIRISLNNIQRSTYFSQPSLIHAFWLLDGWNFWCFPILLLLIR